MPRREAAFRHWLLLVLVAAMLVPAMPASAQERRQFEEDDWYEGLVDLRGVDLANAHQVSTGLIGSGLQVTIGSGRFRGLGSRDRLAQPVDEAWYRYHVQLTDFEVSSTGKLPGLSGLYSDSGRGCHPSSPSAPGWSARGMFGAAGTRGAPVGEVPIGTYLYHLDQPGPCGEALFWPNASLRPGQWHCVEGRVKMNTPGLHDGEVEGWLDGAPRFARAGLAFRRADQPDVAIRELWLDIYYGGRRPSPRSLQLLIDEVAVSTGGRIGCAGSLPAVVGSFDGRGERLAAYDVATGEWRLAGGVTGAAIEPPWVSYRTRDDWVDHLVGDFTGDGRDDLAGYHPANGTWWVSSGAGREARTNLWATFGTPGGWGAHLAGDFTGDGRDDIASYHPGNGSWWVSAAEAERPGESGEEVGDLWPEWLRPDARYLVRAWPPGSTPPPATAFSVKRWGAFSTTNGWSSHLTGDFDGDGRDDVASFHPGRGLWWVGLSTGTDFRHQIWGVYAPSPGWATHLVGDFDGDGRDDVASYHRATGAWWVGLSTGAGFDVSLWETFATTRGWASSLVGDFNGDGRDDIASFHYSNGTWWVSQSTGTSFATDLWSRFSTGSGWTSQVVGDLDGDGRDDIATRHAVTGEWWAALSDGVQFNPTRWPSP